MVNFDVSQRSFFRPIVGNFTNAETLIDDIERVQNMSGVDYIPAAIRRFENVFSQKNGLMHSLENVSWSSLVGI